MSSRRLRRALRRRRRRDRLSTPARARRSSRRPARLRGPSSSSAATSRACDQSRRTCSPRSGSCRASAALPRPGGRAGRPLPGSARPFASFREAARSRRRAASRRARRRGAARASDSTWTSLRSWTGAFRAPGEVVLGDRCAVERSDGSGAARRGLPGGASRARDRRLPQALSGTGTRAASTPTRRCRSFPPTPRRSARDLAPFEALMASARAVMISHAAGPDGAAGLAFSEGRRRTCCADVLGFDGAAFSDDLEMGALDGVRSASRAVCRRRAGRLRPPLRVLAASRSTRTASARVEPRGPARAARRGRSTAGGLRERLQLSTADAPRRRGLERLPRRRALLDAISSRILAALR